MSGTKRKASDDVQDDFLKRSKATNTINNAVAVAESDPRKRKAWAVTDDADSNGKRQFQFQNLNEASIPRGACRPASHDLTQLIRPRLNFDNITLRRTHVYIIAMSDNVPLQPPVMAGPELMIHVHHGTVNIILSTLYECEAQMRTSAVYELDSVLGFLRAVRGHFEWPATDIGIDNPGIVWVIQQLKRHMGYEWQDGPNAARG